MENTILVDFFAKNYRRDKYRTKNGYSYDLEFDTRTSIVETGHQSFTSSTTGYYDKYGKLITGMSEVYEHDSNGEHWNKQLGGGDSMQGTRLRGYYNSCSCFYIGSSLMIKPLPDVVVLQARGLDSERYLGLTSFGYLEIDPPRPVAFLSNRKNSDKVYP